MNDKELKQKTNDACFSLMKETGVITAVDVLMAIGVLSKTDYERWRRGDRVDYLERVCKINLKKLSTMNREIRTFAKKNDLKASWTFYRQWSKLDKNGKAKSKNKAKHQGQDKPQSVKLRFSKSGDEGVERQYATHYISQKTIDEIKERRLQVDDSSVDVASEETTQ